MPHIIKPRVKTEPRGESKYSKIRAPGIDTAWFRQRMAERQTSQRQIAFAIGIDPAAVSLMLRGIRKMQLSEASAIAELLGVTAMEVMERAGYDAPRDISATVRVVGTANDLGLVHFGRVDAPRVLPRPPEMPIDTVAVRLTLSRGAVAPGMDGWHLFYVPATKIEPEAVGRLSVVKVAGGSAYTRVLTKGSKSGLWTLTGNAAKDEAKYRMDDVRVEWASPVVWVRT